MGSGQSAFPFELDEASSTPPWMQLRKRLVFLIESGYFKPGDQLPKIRELAADISMNFNTVNKAYLSLQSDGYVNSIRGKGAFVAERGSAKPSAKGRDLEAVLDDFLRTCRDMGLTYEEAAEQATLRARMLTMAESIPYRVPGSNVIKLAVGGGASEAPKAKEA